MQVNYDIFKQRAIAAQPVATRCSLSEIDVIDEGTMLYKGYPLNLSRGALKNLASILKIPAKFIQEFEVLIGKNGKDKFLNFIKDAKAVRKNQLITLVGNPQNKAIVGIQLSEYMPFETYFQLLEQIMNLQPFDIQDMTFTGNKVAVSAVLKGGKFNVGGLDSENFYPGFTFSNGIGAAGGGSGAGIDNFIYRLICGNGMIGVDPDNGGSIIFGGLKGNLSPDHFFRDVENLAKKNFVPESFTGNVARANNTKASFAEVVSAASVLTKGSEMTKDFVDSFVPVNDIKNRLARQGVDFATLNTAKERSIVTDVTIWDLVNGLTNFASHDYGFHLMPSRKLEIQKIAYNILSRPNFDTENLTGISLS